MSAAPMDPSQAAAEDAAGSPAVRAFPLFGAVSVIIVVLGGTGNLLLVYLSFKKSKLMTAINQLLLSQCLINLTVCFVGIPIKIFLEASGLVFSARDSLCWYLLSWTYASWANFCFSLCLVASVRLLYTVAPLWMHSLQEGRVAALSCGILFLDQLAWFVASVLEDEPPFGSVTCLVEKMEHTSRRIIAAIVFNLTCLLITLGTYLGITFSTARYPLPPPATSRQRNLITARTGIIQCVFFLLTYMLPIGTRLLSYQGAISPTTLAQGNFFFVFFFQKPFEYYGIIVWFSTKRLFPIPDDDGKKLRGIRNLYWERNPAMRVENGRLVGRRSREGFGKSVLSISVYREDLQHILDKVLEEGESLRLPRNAKETNSVSVSEKQIPPK
ncbi:uncharacterized protein [Penaeus vannamei]|uniref:uncharacterized protein n=1 Tax=Penaeus vannamei TaxID=6689 RepID=UPI00387F5AC1